MSVFLFLSSSSRSLKNLDLDLEKKNAKKKKLEKKKLDSPEQYMIFIGHDSSFCSSGLFGPNTIWKWPLHQRDRCWKQLRTCSGASPTTRYSST